MTSPPVPQCIAITAKGTRCSRNAAQGLVTCAAHSRAPDSVIDALQDATTAPQQAESASIVNQSTNEENTTMDAATVAPIAPSEDVAPVITSYKDSTTAIDVVIPRKDAAQRSPVKRASKDQDIAYFDKVLAKRRDIKRYVMPEYFACPDYWTPTLKLKQGESLPDRMERDYNAWLKSYARALRDRKVARIGNVFFFPAKLSPSAFLELIRAGKRAYCLAYAKDSKLFGTDARESIRTLIAINVDFVEVAMVLEFASAYHKAHGKKDAVQVDVDAAHAAYVTAFDTACAALRGIDTGMDVSNVAQLADAVLTDVVA